MKKLLLSLILICSFAIVKAQLTFNEFYTSPGGGESEFIELYNSSGAAINLDPYVVVLYNGTGFYVMDLPADMVASKGIYVMSSAFPFNYQGGTYNVAAPDSNMVWTNPGNLTYWTISGGAFVSSPIANINDIMQEQNGSVKYDFFLFKAEAGGGRLINAFQGGGNTDALVATIRNIAPLLSIPDPDGAGPGVAFNIDWHTNANSGPPAAPTVTMADNQIEYAKSATGSANGYYRLRDGACGAWTKSSAQVNHTPGKNNAAAFVVTDSDLNVTVTFNDCNGVTNPSAISVTMQLNSATAAAFPVTMEIWEDFSPADNPATPKVFEQWLPSGGISTGDQLLSTAQVLQGATLPTSISTSRTPIVHPNAYDPSWNVLFDGQYQTRQLYVIFSTPAGCFNREVYQPACATLPVNFKVFTATRENSGKVALYWETATEANNMGFEVERKLSATADWEKIGYVNSKAFKGNSSELLTYNFDDNANTSKGITQYRLKQVDYDAQSSYSYVRAVRGLQQSGKTVVFPNPSADGKVTVVFEDVNTNRDVSLADMNGRVIKQWRKVSTNTIQIDNLPPGMYHVRIIDTETGDQTVEKIIVNKR